MSAHGVTAYREGCRCDHCRRAVADLEQRRRHRKYLERLDHLNVDATGTTRRLQALCALGWTLAEISRRAGYEKSHTIAILKRTRVHVDTARRIASIYEQLSMTLPPQDDRYQRQSASQARNLARQRGWLPPLAWDDIDDPSERPGDAAADADDRIDHAVVERLLGGEFRHPSTEAEKAEACRRWHASGRSLHNLAKWSGWKVERYYKASDEEAA